MWEPLVVFSPKYLQRERSFQPPWVQKWVLPTLKQRVCRRDATRPIIIALDRKRLHEAPLDITIERASCAIIFIHEQGEYAHTVRACLLNRDVNYRDLECLFKLLVCSCWFGYPNYFCRTSSRGTDFSQHFVEKNLFKYAF